MSPHFQRWWDKYPLIFKSLAEDCNFNLESIVQVGQRTQIQSLILFRFLWWSFEHHNLTPHSYIYNIMTEQALQQVSKILMAQLQYTVTANYVNVL